MAPGSQTCQPLRSGARKTSILHKLAGHRYFVIAAGNTQTRPLFPTDLGAPRGRGLLPYPGGELPAHQMAQRVLRKHLWPVCGTCVLNGPSGSTQVPLPDPSVPLPPSSRLLLCNSQASRARREIRKEEDPCERAASLQASHLQKCPVPMLKLTEKSPRALDSSLPGTSATERARAQVSSEHPLPAASSPHRAAPRGQRSAETRLVVSSWQNLQAP